MARRRSRRGFMSALRDLIDEYDDDEREDDDDDERGSDRALRDGDIVVVRGRSARTLLDRIVGTGDEEEEAENGETGDEKTDDGEEKESGEKERKTDKTPRRRGYFDAPST